MKLRRLLTGWTPITLVFVVIHALLLAARLAVARPTTPPLRPATERPLEAAPGRQVVDLQALTPRWALAVLYGQKGGTYLIDWSRSARLQDAGELEAIALFGDAAGRRADQWLTVDGGLLTVTGSRDHAWRFFWDVEGRRVVRRRLPRRFLWLAPDGEAVTENDLRMPPDWPAIYPPSVMTSDGLVLARPEVEQEGAPGASDAVVRRRAAERDLMIFDWHRAAPLARLETGRIRYLFAVPGWRGFAWTDEGSCWLHYATCDADGACRLGTSGLRATEPIFAASFRPDRDRLAVCSTRHVLFYEGRLEGDLRFLGRAPIAKPCRNLELTSDRGAAVMLEDRSWVVVQMEARP